MKHMEERISRYANGALATSQWRLSASNANYGFIREVDPSEYPHLTKRDFLKINENESYDISDL